MFDLRSEPSLREIGFKQIAKLLSYKIEIEIIFGNREYHLSRYSIIAFMQNMPQIKDISFRANAYYNIRELIPCFGHNIRSLSIQNSNTLIIEDLNAIKNNKNLV